MCVYQYAVVRSRMHPEDVARHCGITVAAVHEAIAVLVSYRLLEPADPDSGEYAAVAPGTAAAQLLGPVERELRDRQMQVTGVHALLTSLIPLYEEGSIRRRLPGAIEVLSDRDTVARVLTELAANCRTEMLDAHPGGARREEGPHEAIDRDKDMLHRGVQMYVLYQHGAQFHPPTVAHAEYIMGLGAQVRTVVGGLQRMVVFDREHAMIPLRTAPNGAIGAGASLAALPTASGNGNAATTTDGHARANGGRAAERDATERDATEADATVANAPEDANGDTSGDTSGSANGGESGGAVLIRDPSTVGFLVQSFETCWLTAQPFGGGQGKESLRLLSDRTKRVLVQMLVDGASDQAVARTLGVSVRTCQRHIAEVMSRLSAKNRLQLGYLVHRLGLLDDDPATGTDGNGSG